MVTEYVLLHALGKAFGCQLDAHGVSVIDFQQSGSAGIYPALADGFGIPWTLICDGDAEGTKFKAQILDRGFEERDLTTRFITLTPPNDLEGQLIADGHEHLLRQILASSCGPSVLTCSQEELRARLKNRKTSYMGALSLLVSKDRGLAERMPQPFVQMVRSLRRFNQ